MNFATTIQRLADEKELDFKKMDSDTILIFEKIEDGKEPEYDEIAPICRTLEMSSHRLILEFILDDIPPEKQEIFDAIMPILDVIVPK